ncbi:hypothetical protein BS50DRAFT_19466 [Corynespora cassiicola Philippines]|uniref:Uncharacterized protein n=1 Tax=Corynespora cassiicola Philippines TaxID=1448308 RepID=A0A2T2PB46_CORCC|nr:hypothetical protein BS50DRAFT_19466 [Corynespora cassiicola Philippines]
MTLLALTRRRGSVVAAAHACQRSRGHAGRLAWSAGACAIAVSTKFMLVTGLWRLDSNWSHHARAAKLDKGNLRLEIASKLRVPSLETLPRRQQNIGPQL